MVDLEWSVIDCITRRLYYLTTSCCALWQRSFFRPGCKVLILGSHLSVASSVHHACCFVLVEFVYVIRNLKWFTCECIYLFLPSAQLWLNNVSKLFSVFFVVLWTPRMMPAVDDLPGCSKSFPVLLQKNDTKESFCGALGWSKAHRWLHVHPRTILVLKRFSWLIYPS